MAEDTLSEINSEPTCGIVMPLSAIDGCSAAHWQDVQSIIKESVGSIEDPKFSTKMVSDADEVGVIQKRIVSNIYLSDIVVCDVSCRNPNVMFELGMRLAFDRPAVIIKDDKTPYSFDTSVIEHLTYPRDLRYNIMQQFRELLAEKVLSTYRKAKDDPAHSTFLRNFGTFKVANLHTEEVKSDQIVMAMIEQMQSQVSRLTANVDRLGRSIETSGVRSTDPAYLLAKRILRKERAEMPDGAWEHYSADHGFLAHIANRVSDEFPDRKNLLPVVERAIKTVTASPRE